MTWLWLFPGTRHVCDRLDHLERTLMTQIDELREAIAQAGVDLGEAVDRVEAKLADTEVDLGPEIEQLRSFGEQLDSIAVEGPGSEGEPPVEGEEPVEGDLVDEDLPFDQDNPTGP